MQNQPYSEYMQEALLHLEEARRQERKQRQESDAILSSLSALIGATSRDEVLSTLRKTFHSLINCDDCWILQPHEDHLITENNIKFPVGKGFSRVLNGGVLNAFDVTQVPEWHDIKMDGTRSAIHVPLKLSPDDRGILILTSSRPAAFTRESIELVMHIIPLTEQAIVKIEQIEKTHAAQMVEQWQLMQLIMDHAPIGIFMLNKQGRVMFINRAFCNMVGIPETRFIEAENYTEVLPKALVKQCMASDSACFEQGTAITARETITNQDGREYIIDTTKAPVYNSAGEITALVGISVDVTEQHERSQEKEQIQQQLQHTQKLESLGVLAGGIAHDFNNILAAIMGHASLAESKCKQSDPLAVEQHLGRIVTASEKAADLCKQMLAYSGHGKFIIKPLDISAFVESILNILEVSLNKGVILKLSLIENLPMVEADASQMQQILMNLVTNANEAIASRSGVIAIRTGIMDAGENYLTHCLCAEDIHPGRFVFMEVSDTGSGMNGETIEKIFDPFFTTKFTGRGLGMSAVLGIIRGHQGALKLYSEPGQGTTFRVLLPALDIPRPNKKATEENPLHNTGIHKVLVVDDEESMREITQMMLLDAGVDEILTAEDGRNAIQIYQREGETIDLIILDLTMPHMDGEETFRQLRLINPEIKVILASGYSRQSIEDRFAGKGLCGFLQKPFTPEILRKVVTDSL